jgi:DNA-binding NtrC family response regulator
VLTTTLLVISPTDELRRSLAAALADSCSVTGARPGAGVLRVVQRERPRVVIVDCIDERPEAAQLEIALVKELCPRTRVIALSRHSSDADAFVVEQGIFCYVASPCEDELVRLIHAATRAVDAEVIESS